MSLERLMKSDCCHRRPTAKGVGLRVADSDTGNHPEDGFMPLETIRRLLVVIGRRSYPDFKGEAFEPERRVILPKKSQTILDALLGYVGMYTHHFSLSNLRLPIPPFICEVLNYFKVHISYFNPFGVAKLTTFSMMCKAYKGKPTVDLLWSFLNLGPAGDWLTLSNRGSADVPKALLKPITYLGNWKDSFFFIENKIIPSNYLELLLNENKLDKKSFKDKVPLHPKMDPLYDQIAMYPCIVQTFPDPILYLAGLKTTWKHSPKRPFFIEMDFRSFMLKGVDGELNILPMEGVSEGQNSPSSKSINNDASVISATPLSSVYPSNIVENVVDSDDLSYGEDEQTLVGPSLPPHPEDNKKLKILGKWNIASGILGKALPLKVQKVHARASKVASEAFTPLDVDNDSDIHAKELRDATDCHWVVAYVTPPSWKQHLREISIDRLDKDRAYAKLERKCNEALQDLDKNPLVSDMYTEIKVLQGQVDGLHNKYSRLILEEKNRRLDSLKQDRAAIVSKVISDASMKLVRSDDLGVLIVKLVRSSIIYGRCQAFKEVAAMKEPFILEKCQLIAFVKEEYDKLVILYANASYTLLS
ncbi:hypothetical protein Tco_0681856 [Tanacetum coccineum]|uniref:Transposase (putative) gypsy type domain-containing protein n=1 Tax=Tanacetum coccineum TaxID=301880 RepID=A0ABQ4XPI3_9ASTR